MDAATFRGEKRALRPAGLSQAQQPPRPVNEAPLERARRHLEERGRALQIRFRQVDEAALVAAGRASPDTSETKSLHAHSIATVLLPFPRERRYYQGMKANIPANSRPGLFGCD